MEALPSLVQINPDLMLEDTELHESVDIKEDFTEDMLEENSDPTNVNMSPNQEEDSDSKPPENELEVGDFPIIRIPTTLSENEMLEIFKKHNFAFDGQYTCESELANKLQYAMKTYHPLSRILKKVSIVKISNLHDFILGHQAHENNTSPSTRLGEHYFKKHWKSPLTSFLKDMKRFDLATTWQEINVGKIPKEDPSIVVDPEASRSQLIEELKSHGHKNASDYSDFTNCCVTDKQLREKLEETLRCTHPIHKVIGRLKLEELKALICYAGHYSKVYGNERYRGKREDIMYPRLLSKIIFESKPEAPISYLTQIQKVYRKNGPEGHRAALETFKTQLESGPSDPQKDPNPSISDPLASHQNSKFMCHWCHKKFVSKNEVTTHLKDQHKTLPMVCGIIVPSKVEEKQDEANPSAAKRAKLPPLVPIQNPKPQTAPKPIENANQPMIVNENIDASDPLAFVQEEEAKETDFVQEEEAKESDNYVKVDKIVINQSAAKVKEEVLPPVELIQVEKPDRDPTTESKTDHSNDPLLLDADQEMSSVEQEIKHGQVEETDSDNDDSVDPLTDSKSEHPNDPLLVQDHQETVVKEEIELENVEETESDKDDSVDPLTDSNAEECPDDPLAFDEEEQNTATLNKFHGYGKRGKKKERTLKKERQMQRVFTDFIKAKLNITLEKLIKDKTTLEDILIQFFESYRAKKGHEPNSWLRPKINTYNTYRCHIRLIILQKSEGKLDIQNQVHFKKFHRFYQTKILQKKENPYFVQERSVKSRSTVKKEQLIYRMLTEFIKEKRNCSLEELLKDNLLEFLGFEEVHEILSRPKLCVWSQKYVCDSILQWILQKQSPAEDMDDQEVNMIAEMKFRLRDTFANMTELYFDKKTISHLLPVASTSGKTNRVVPRQPKQASEGCMDCVFIVPWARDEKDICGLELYLEERKEQQVFTSWNLKDEKCREIKCMQAGRSFFQHYGPVYTKSGCLVNCDSYLFYLGGVKMNNQISKRGRDNGCISDEAFVFETASLSWLRMTSRLPKSLTQFGALFISPHLYLIGGLTYDSEKNTFLHTVDARKYFISRTIYRIHVDDWFSSSQSWQNIGEIPEDRINFSVANLDNNKICIVSSMAVDIFDIAEKTWLTITQPSSHLKTIGHEKPAIAILGTTLHIINSKCETIGSNAMWKIDLADHQSLPAWQPLLPSLDLRFDPVQAFSHNGALFVIGHQTALRNFAYKFDPVKKEWTKQLESFSGHFVNGAGILLRRQRVKKAFFQSF